MTGDMLLVVSKRSQIKQQNAKCTCMCTVQIIPNLVIECLHQAITSGSRIWQSMLIIVNRSDTDNCTKALYY